MADQAGIENLWRRHSDEIYGFVRRRVGSSSVAEDITSDVFVAVAKTIGNDPDVEIGVGFLYTVARRRIFDTWRTLERQGRLVERCASFMQSRATVGDDLSDALLDLSWTEALPARQRTALLLRYFDDLTVGETAAQMDVSYQSVESLLARGRRSARTALENDPAFA